VATGSIAAGFRSLPVLGRDKLEVRVDEALVKVIPQIRAGVKRLFDLNCDPTEIASVLGAMAEERPGPQIPGAFDGFEMAVRRILG
jgi:3-methyladenine DNA glycosylase/8-oxoguanine DNA glycosylase